MFTLEDAKFNSIFAEDELFFHDDIAVFFFGKKFVKSKCLKVHVGTLKHFDLTLSDILIYQIISVKYM
jgi:hypothetical protein